MKHDWKPVGYRRINGLDIVIAWACACTDPPHTTDTDPSTLVEQYRSGFLPSTADLAATLARIEAKVDQLTQQIEQFSRESDRKHITILNDSFAERIRHTVTDAVATAGCKATVGMEQP